jgi:signal transduction histidine kinase
MQAAPLPLSERARLEALYRYQILDTPPQAAFDAIARTAAQLAGAPIAVISFVDANRQWFKARIGLDQTETERCVAFCGYTILGDDVFEVCDAAGDDRFADNPLVTVSPGIRYYAGAPIVTRENFALGALCIIDTAPRGPLMEKDRQSLRDLAALIVDQLELRVAFQERVDFVTNLAHEVRNPLQAVIGYADLICAAKFGEVHPPRYAEYVRHIQAACGHVIDVMSEFLDFSKLEAGHLSLKETEVDLRALIGECAAIVGARMAAAGLKFVVSAGPSVGTVVADANRLRQLVLNILMNAVKFTRPGGSVSVDLCGDSVRGVRLVITDTGIGIRAEDMAKVLKPFGQVHKGFVKEISGTGLGLPFAARLAALHGGSLKIKSKPGRGTVVTVFLPPHRYVGRSHTAEKPSLKAVG